MHPPKRAALPNVCLIINPAAGRGHIARATPHVRAAFQAHGFDTVHQTTKSGDEETLAAQAIRSGAEIIVAVGGDGTCSRVANAIISSQSRCALAVVPGGTGNDFAKTLGVAGLTPAAVAELVVTGNSTPVDVGWADGFYFLNSCGFGFDAAVLEASNTNRFLKGDAVYIYSALRQLFTYAGVQVSVSGAPGIGQGRMLMVTVSNGRSLGGAFRIAPRASVLDGKLDACFFQDSGLTRRLRMFMAAFRGAHVGMSGVVTAAVSQLELSFPDKPSMEMDGELRVARSSTVGLRCFPGALRVIAAPRAIH